MLHLDIETRKLTSDSGYIHSLDDELYVDYPIYIAKSQTENDYEEGDEQGYERWIEEHTEPEEDDR